MINKKFKHEVLEEHKKKAYEKHSIISEDLYNFGSYLFGDDERLRIAKDISLSLELSYWGMDDLIDRNKTTSKEEVYYTLFSIHWNIREFFKDLLQYMPKEDAVSLLNILEEPELSLWQLAEKEKEIQGNLDNPKLSIIQLLEARGHHAEIYIALFNELLNTDVFLEYLNYRKLSLLHKDFMEEDIKEDFENDNLSSATIIYHAISTSRISKEEARKIVSEIGKELIDSIHEDYFKKQAELLYKDLPLKVNKFLRHLP